MTTQNASEDSGRLTLPCGLRFATAGLVLLIYWSTCAFVLLPLAGVTFHLRGQPRRRELGQSALNLMFRGVAGILKCFGVVEVSYEGFDRLKLQTGPLILAPNHPALWDAVFVITEAGRASCVLKASLMHNPLLVVGSSMAGYVKNEPLHRMLKTCLERLRGGERVLFFPEGTRTRPEHGAVNPLTGSLAVLARQSRAPVIPVIIQTSSRYLGKGWPIWRLPREMVHLRLSLGEPLTCGPDEETADFLERLRAVYVTAGCGGRAAAT